VNQTISDTRVRAMIRDGITRSIGVIGLAGVALIHAIDAPSHLVGGPDTWLGVMYIGLMISCLVLAAGLIHSGDRRLWMAVAGLITTVVIGFTLSRTTGLPGDSADIGNWGEPIGIASLFVEGTLIALSTAVARGVLDTVTPAAPRTGVARPGARGQRTLSAA
jgi:hypothetical protein